MKSETTMISRVRHRMDKKGIAIPVAIVIMAGWLLLLSAFLYFVMTEYKHTTMLVREVEMLEGVEFMEAVKRGMEDAISYSLHRATYDVLEMGGHCEHNLDPTDSGYCEEECLIRSDVPTTECVPWWRQYSQDYYIGLEDFKKYVVGKAHQYMQGYATAYEEIDNGLEIPDYCPSEVSSGDITNTLSDTSYSVVRIGPEDSVYHHVSGEADTEHHPPMGIWK